MGQRLLAVALFGSVARGQATEESDIDLLVVVNEKPSNALQECLLVRRQVEPYPLRRISPIVTTPEMLRQNFLILLDILDHGIILHDPEGVLGDLLSRLKRRLEEWGSKKVQLPDGSWYWQLKPDRKLGETLSYEL
ncbi:hypothetical protein GG496_000455 [Candidatus Fervidibacteria bacterium JGI MDM2 JNZ-1-D12]